MGAWDDERRTDVPLEHGVNRVEELVAHLGSDKPSGFCSPRCLGFFDDRTNSKRSKNEYRFDLVYEKPSEDASPVSLRRLLDEIPPPPLSDRTQLAHKTATCVLYLYAVNWLHKTPKSDSIIVLPEKSKFDLRQSFITGYEYARPDRWG